MVKLIGAIASLFIGNYVNHSKPTSVLVMDFLASKSRVIILMIMACITLSTLFTSGVVLSILGVSTWVNASGPETIASAQFITYSGIGLIIVCAITTFAIFTKSKSALEMKQPETKQPEHPIQDALLSFINELTKEKPAKNAEPQAENKPVVKAKAQPVSEPITQPVSYPKPMIERPVIRDRTIDSSSTKH